MVMRHIGQVQAPVSSVQCSESVSLFQLKMKFTLFLCAAAVLAAPAISQSKFIKFQRHGIVYHLYKSRVVLCLDYVCIVQDQRENTAHFGIIYGALQDSCPLERVNRGGLSSA